jgi:hypothetical protein
VLPTTLADDGNNSTCTWPQTCADIETFTRPGETRDDAVDRSGGEEPVRYSPTEQRTGLVAIPAGSASAASCATLELRLYRKLRNPRLLLHLVDAVQHRLETVRQRAPYSAHLQLPFISFFLPFRFTCACHCVAGSSLLLLCLVTEPSLELSHLVEAVFIVSAVFIVFFKE